MICFYLKQQSETIICTYIWRNYVWTETRCIQWYKRIIIGNIIRSYLQQKICFVNSFCSYIAKNILFWKKEEANEVQLSRNNYFFFQELEPKLFLCILEIIKFLLSDFRKWCFYIEKLSYWEIPKKFIDLKLWRLSAERPYKIFLRWKICVK